MSSGLPVVAVDKLAVNEVVISGKNGYLSAPNDAEKMAKNILKMSSDQDRLEKFGKTSVTIAKTHEVSECKNVLYKQYQIVSGKDWLRQTLLSSPLLWYDDSDDSRY